MTGIDTLLGMGSAPGSVTGLIRATALTNSGTTGVALVQIDGASTSVTAFMDANMSVSTGDRLVCAKVQSQVYVVLNQTHTGTLHSPRQVTDCNLAVEPGVYYILSAANGPPSASTWIMEVFSDTNFQAAVAVHQVARRLTSNATMPEVWERLLGSSGAWGQWHCSYDPVKYAEYGNVNNWTTSASAGYSWPGATLNTLGNQGTAFAASTGIFTAPTEGLYALGFSAYTSALTASGRFIAAITTDSGHSSVVARDEGSDAATYGYSSVCVSTEYYCTAGLKLYCAFYSSGGYVSNAVVGNQWYCRLVERYIENQYSEGSPF